MKNSKYLLEGCIDNKEDASYMKDKKINRLEVCSCLKKGGLTPSYDLVEYCTKDLKIDSVIMLRESNNFKLSFFNFMKIKFKIKRIKSLHPYAYIFGFIKNGEIDISKCKKIIGLLGEAKYAFHMAIDEVNDYDKALNSLIELGFSWVLTKGGKGKAVQNINQLKYLVDKYDSKIKILIGGSVTKNNYLDLSKLTKGD